MKDKKKKTIKKKIVKKPKRQLKKPKKIVKKQPKKEYVSKHGVKEKKIKIRYGRIIICLIILGGILYYIFNYMKIPIRNIFVSGNTTISDQEIIELANLENYPNFYKLSSRKRFRKKYLYNGC